MKEDLRRLIDEFLKETREARIVTVETGGTDSEPSTERELRAPTFDDFIWWLKGEFPEKDDE